MPDSWGNRSVHLTSFVFSFLHSNIKLVGQNAVGLPLVLGGLDSHALVSCSLGHAELIWETSNSGRVGTEVSPSGVSELESVCGVLQLGTHDKRNKLKL